MKTKFVLALPVLCLFLMSMTPFATAPSKLDANAPDLKIVGIYDGNEGYGYNFITKHKEDESEFTMTFQKVKEEVMKSFDLDAETYLNKKFEVTYAVKKVVTKDENGFEEENEVFTITDLKPL